MFKNILYILYIAVHTLSGSRWIETVLPEYVQVSGELRAAIQSLPAPKATAGVFC